MNQLKLIQQGQPRNKWKTILKGSMKEIRIFCNHHKFKYTGDHIYKSKLGDLYCII